MLSTELLECIECAMPHRCAKRENPSNNCAQCLVGYSFVACEPISLECGHHICKQCREKTQKEPLRCKFCNKLIRTSNSFGSAAELLIKANLKFLTRDLIEKYSHANSLFEERSLFIESESKRAKDQLKHEIDMRVERLKAELDQAREKLHEEVDRYYDDAPKYFFLF